MLRAVPLALLAALAPGIEHTTTIRFAKPTRRPVVTVAPADATIRLDVRL